MIRAGIAFTSCLLVFFPQVVSQIHAAEVSGVLETVEGAVEVTRGRNALLVKTNGFALHIADKVRTLEHSRATIRWQGGTLLRVAELSSVEIRPAETNRPAKLNLFQGAIRWFSRLRSPDLEFETPHCVGGARGTEFELAVAPDATFLRVFDGQAVLTNAAGTWLLNANEAGRVETTTAPLPLEAISPGRVQWWLFYPAVLDPRDLGLDAAAARLADALRTYDQGDVRAALSNWPQPDALSSEAERVFKASLLLSAGSIGECTNLLASVDQQTPGVRALRWLIEAVNGELSATESQPRNASDWLAHSYYNQSRGDLEGALRSARFAAEAAPEFPFALVRLGEMEFSFGRLAQAEVLLARALAIGPRNAQAHALRGFILAGLNRFREAEGAFEESIRLDPALGNGWLGRGLCRFHAGDTDRGLQDLQLAAALEPNRALLRSYLGKAWAETGERLWARAELDLAKRIDAEDPTPWLYSALLAYEENRANDGVEELEQSLALNDNRGVYRSRFLLDEDRAVRSASLARIYQRAGLNAPGFREAAKAVSYDYGNYSAHLFLADSYYGLLDPTRFNLRYYTAWLSELLVADLLAPVNAGIFSPSVSQQEYSRLFDRSGFGGGLVSEIRSDGRYRQSAWQNGIFSRSAYSLDLDFQRNEGVRRNNDLDRLDAALRLKHQLGDHDTLSAIIRLETLESGDNFQYHDPAEARPHYRFEEQELPVLLGGWRHDWGPGVRTLALAGRIVNRQEFADRDAPQALLVGSGGNFAFVDQLPYDVDYENRFEAWTAELQQLVSWPSLRSTLIFGGRAQTGDVEVRSELSSSDPLVSPSTHDRVEEDFYRFSVYAYDHITVVDPLTLVAGVAYDRVEAPINYRNPPLAEGQDSHDFVSPKAAIVWNPAEFIALRAMYSQSLTGVSLDDSYRLEPSQLAGFVQAYRTIIPESLAGSAAGQRLEQAGVAFDLKLAGRTYLGLFGESATSTLNRDIGIFELDLANPPAQPAGTRESLHFRENSAGLALHKLIGRDWSLGATYRFSRATLKRGFPEISQVLEDRSDLHEAILSAHFNHPSGFFGTADCVLLWQDSEGQSAASSDTVQQGNVRFGWRFRRNHGEVAAGIMNVVGDDYRLHPLSAYPELPRERVFFARLVLSF